MGGVRPLRGTRRRLLRLRGSSTSVGSAGGRRSSSWAWRRKGRRGGEGRVVVVVVPLRHPRAIHMQRATLPVLHRRRRRTVEEDEPLFDAALQRCEDARMCSSGQ